jgi:lipoprotein-anchoring transpeptidase ErfK/SrfK
MHRLALLATVAILVLQAADVARADVVVTIDRASQRMSVAVDGAERHKWVISTGTRGGPPGGSYRPQRMERKWFSRKYGWSPMPNSIFFHEGYAIHGTIYVSQLGRRASHGCVRLHPSNAAILFALVQKEGMGNTTIIVR